MFTCKQICFLVFCCIPLYKITASTNVDSWAVKIVSRKHLDTNQVADSVAGEMGLINEGRIEPFQDWYKFTATITSTRIKRDFSNLFDDHPSVLVSHKQTVLKRTKRFYFNDPKYSSQWHLHNRREIGHDVNASWVWSRGVTGRGVVVAIVDDGVEHKNPDLSNNYEPRGSYDFNDADFDPSPHTNTKQDNHHGTRCAGLIGGGANNSVCGVGVAFGARVAGIRMLDGSVTDILEAQSFVYKAHVNHVYSCSWGPEDNGHTIEGPGPLAKEALFRGTREGRYGYGNVYVFASGNGGTMKDNCNFDGYANSIYTLTVGAVDEMNRMPYYAELCAAMLAVTYSNGQQRSIVTTDGVDRGGCTDGFTGTSAAAPIAAGMVALMLEIRPCLRWRDVQSIVVYTGLTVDSTGAVWVRNGAGLLHSDQHGFGLMDSYALSVVSAVWPLLPSMSTATLTASNTPVTMTMQPLIAKYTVLSSDIPDDLVTLEYVAVKMVMSHDCRGSLELSLTSPTGTLSTLITPRRYDTSQDGFDWTVTSARFWGEVPLGEWKLNITDHTNICPKRARKKSIVQTCTLTFYGSSLTPKDVANRIKLVKDAISNRSLQLQHPCPIVNHTHEDIDIHDSSHKSISTVEIVVVAIVTVIVVVSCLHLTVELVCSRVKSYCRVRTSTAVLYVNKDNNEREEECALLSSENEEDTLIFLNDRIIRENGNSNNCISTDSLNVESGANDVVDTRTDQSDEETDCGNKSNETSLLLQQV